MSIHTGKIVDVVKDIDIIECEECGFRHINPLPTVEELIDTYKHDYYTKEKPLSLERYKEDEHWYQIQYADRYDTFEDHFNNTKQTRSILDVGSGAGLFLKSGMARGWETQGIEPSQQASKHSIDLGINTIVDFLTEDTLKQLKQYDAVHASLVVEHVPNAVELLSYIYRLTKPGGIICLTVPNDYNPLQAALVDVTGIKPWWIVPTHHMNYFTPTSFEKLIQRTGFKVVLKENTFPIDMFLLMGDNYIGNDSLGRQTHKRRIAFEKTLFDAGKNDLKRKIYRSLSELDLGREICIYAIKEE
ncbi:MAG: 2-polyprenyl-3-methyl-5-hydroxy-6-metoxy-1,4-benzoquinol methylase [Flavobacteriales bacterium]|jgi:2-polyprenyl-3-methyl-5-hydroxy-6-metoxy-1,4-benzoquinol methylase